MRVYNENRNKSVSDDIAATVKVIQALALTMCDVIYHKQ